MRSCRAPPCYRLGPTFWEADGSVLNAMANSPFFTEKHWITPDESPHATFCVFFSSDKGST